MLQPRPAIVRVTSANGETQKLTVVPGAVWVGIAESIRALQPDLIEALDATGGFLRAVRPAEMAHDKEDDEAAAVSSLAADPENARLITFAKLLAEAYKHSTETAFNKMVDLFEAVNRRSESLEKSLEATQRILQRTVTAEIAQNAADPAAGGSVLEQLLAAFLSGQQQGAVATAPAPQPRGPVNGAPPQEESTEADS